MTKDNYSYFFTDLFEEMKDKAKNSKPKESYTARLTRLGAEEVSKKFMEEAFEICLAAVDAEREGGKSNIVPEAADVIYHLFALLVSRGVDLEEVVHELERRNK